MKRLISGLVLTCGALSLSAAEITADQARQAVECWKSLSAAVTGEVAEVRTHRDASSGARFHVARLKKGGFVVLSADDGQDPIYAFSSSEEFQADPGSPLWQVLCRLAGTAAQTSAQPTNGSPARLKSVAGATVSSGMTPQAKWRILLGGEAVEQEENAPRKLKAVGSNSGQSSVFHVAVPQLLKTHWGQGGVGDLRCYDMYTPVKEPEEQLVRQVASERMVAGDAEELDGVHCPCGCVATAGAQLMKFFAYPTATVSKRKKSCKAFGKSVTLETRGERYRWSDMPDRPSTATPQSMREAIGTLTYDVGVVCGASYNIDETSASSYSLASALTDVFGYSQATYFSFGGNLARTTENFRRVIVPNLICRKPVLMSMQGTGGHEIVVDGYGYDSSYGCAEEELYVHLNFGWSGQYDVWFRPPLTSDPIQASSHKYNYFDSLIANIAKTGTGSIVAGRVLRMDSVTSRNYPVYLVKVQLTGRTSGGVAVSKEFETDSEGHYHFIVQPGDYELYAYQTGGPSQSSHYAIQVSTCTSTKIGNVLFDLQLDEAAAAATPVVNRAQLLKNILDVTCNMSGTTIRYTEDGTDPTELSTLYVGPIIALRSGEYRFAAFAPGMARSQVVSVSISVAKWKTDSFDKAGALVGESGSVELTNEGASRESGEPYHGDYSGGASVWTSFTPETDGDYTFTVNGKDVGTGTASYVMMSVYTGDSLSDLQKIVSDGRSKDCRVSLHAKAGVTYRLAMDTYQGVASNLILKWEPGFFDTIELENEGAFASSTGGRQMIGMTCTSPWRVTSSPTWVTMVVSSGEFGDALVFSAQPNTTGKVRQGALTIACGNAEPVAVTVTQGTLNWLRSRTEAMDAAKSSGKPILLVYGRETCPNTRSTMFSSCEDASLRRTLNAEYVLWFCNCDLAATRPEGSVYFSGSGYSTLPFVCVIDPTTPDSCLLHAGSYQSASNLSSLLSRAKKVPALAVAKGTSPENVTLSWTAVPGATSYVVYRGSSANSLSVLKRDVTACSYVDSTAATGEQYFYAVAAVVNGSTGEHAPAAIGYRQLATPVVAVGKSTNTSYRYAPSLSWPSVAGAAYYLVTRRYEDGAEASFWVSATSYLDYNYEAGRRATYTVSAVRSRTWNSERQAYVPTDSSQGSVAVFHLEGASIVFDPGNGDTYMPRYTYDLGTTATYLYTPSRDGYRFDGWYTARTGGTQVTAPLTVSKRHTTLYAHWTPYAYRVDLMAPEAIYGRTPLYLVATVTNLTSGVKCVTNEASWRVVSGTAAAFDSDGALVPVAVSGQITVEGKVNYWGAETVRRATIAVVRESDIRGLVVEGTDKFDPLYENSAPYGAFLTSADNRRFRVTPSWAVTCPNASVCSISSSGELTVDSSRLVSTARVTAVYGKWTASAETVVYGYTLSFSDWSCDLMANGTAIWPGKEVVLSLGTVRWMRHNGELLARRGDVSGLRFSYSVSGSRYFSGDGLRFVVPNDLCDSNEKLWVYLYCYSERTGRYVTTGTLQLNFFTAKPAMTTVLFDAGGGTVAPNTMTFANGYPYLQFPEVKRTGYSLAGWYTAGTGGTPKTTESNCVSSVTKLYAQWRPIYYYVEFEANGGTGAMGWQSAYYDQSLTLSKNRFTKDGDVFLGWSTERYGKIVYTDGETVKNLYPDGYGTVILYAVWKSQKYYRTRYFSGYGANDSLEMPYETSRVHALPKNVFTRYGYRFAGWACSNGRLYDDGMLVFDLAQPGEAVTMTAIWE